LSLSLAELPTEGTDFYSVVIIQDPWFITYVTNADRPMMEKSSQSEFQN